MVDLIESIIVEDCCSYCNAIADGRVPCEERCNIFIHSKIDIEQGIKKWLSSFDTSSATECFTAVNILKERLEKNE